MKQEPKSKARLQQSEIPSSQQQGRGCLLDGCEQSSKQSTERVLLLACATCHRPRSASSVESNKRVTGFHCALGSTQATRSWLSEPSDPPENGPHLVDENALKIHAQDPEQQDGSCTSPSFRYRQQCYGLPYQKPKEPSRETLADSPLVTKLCATRSCLRPDASTCGLRAGRYAGAEQGCTSCMSSEPSILLGALSQARRTSLPRSSTTVLDLRVVLPRGIGKRRRT